MSYKFEKVKELTSGADIGVKAKSVFIRLELMESLMNEAFETIHVSSSLFYTRVYKQNVKMCIIFCQKVEVDDVWYVIVPFDYWIKE